MTTTLLLRLAGPMQSWGDSSRFNNRQTSPRPTKSGVVGLLAAAEGRRRTDPVEDLVGLRFGVRVDQPGVGEVDFQTAVRWRTGERLPLSHRHYLADAAFLVGLEGPLDMLEALRTAIERPVFSLYLGRRAFPPVGRVVVGLTDGDLESSLQVERWHAARWYRRRHRRDERIALDCYVDGRPGEPGAAVRDVPTSFDPADRRFGWRTVTHFQTTVENDEYTERGGPERVDYFATAAQA